MYENIALVSYFLLCVKAIAEAHGVKGKSFGIFTYLM